MSVESPLAKPRSRTQIQRSPMTHACPRCKSHLLFFPHILWPSVLPSPNSSKIPAAHPSIPLSPSSVPRYNLPLQEPSLSSAQPPTPQSQPSRAAFVFILITVLFDFLAFGIIAPVLPNLIIQFEGGNIARAAAITGYFGFAWALMQFIFSPILGAWSDRFGRRPVILISCFGLGLDYSFIALAPSLKWLLVGRIISGITASNISSAFAYVTDVTPSEKRAKQFGYLAASFGMSFIIGPAVGGFLGNINLRFPFWAAAALSLANALYGFFVLPESLPKERRSKSAWHMANPLGSLTLLRSHPQLFGLATVMTLFYLAQH